MTVEPDCVVCGNNLHRNWFWSDFHGECICATCGMIYDMKGYRDTPETRCRIQEALIPIFKEYWEEAKRAVSLGFFMKQTESQREAIQALNEWIEEKHPELIMEKEK